MAIDPSPRFAIWLLLTHALASAVLYVTNMPLAAKLVAFPLILLGLFYCLCRDALLFCAGSWRKISFDQSGVSIVRSDGSIFSGQVARQTVVSPHFVVLLVDQPGCSLPVARVIFPDAMGAGLFREMCVRLKFA